MSMRKTYLSPLFSALSLVVVFPQVSMADVTIGLDVGRAEARKYCEDLSPCDDADKSAKVSLGSDFNETFAWELGYTSFGTIFESSDSQIQAEQDSRAITASALANLPFTNWFGIYGRLGLAWYSSNSSGTVLGVPARDESGTTPFFGAGLRFDFTKNFALRAEYQIYSDISRVDGREDDVQGLYAGVLFKL